MNTKRVLKSSLFAVGAIALVTPALEATTLDAHSGLQFTSGAVVYIGLKRLEHEDGVGTIWEAIPKNHDLDTGPVTPVVVLAPDLVTPIAAEFDPSEFQAATTLDTHSGLEFTSGAVVYIGLDLLEHEDGVGTIWLAIPKNHDLDTGPVTPVIVLAPDVVTPIAADFDANTFEALTMNPDSPTESDDFEAVTELDNHSGLQFTSGAVDYIGLEILEHEDGVGTIWLAIPKNHDLDTGPVEFNIVLAPDVVTGIGQDDFIPAFWGFVLRSIGAQRLADIDGDGCASGADVSILLENFGRGGEREQGDLNGDGIVTMADYTILHQYFGLCGPGESAPAEVDERAQQIAELIGRGTFLPDTDGDGVPDGFEELKGSNPYDSSDFLRITGSEIADEGLALEWRSVAGMVYVIERSESGTKDSWESVDAGPVRAESQSTVQTVPLLPADGPAVFYRVRAQ